LHVLRGLQQLDLDPRHDLDVIGVVIEAYLSSMAMLLGSSDMAFIEAMYRTMLIHRLLDKKAATPI